jgi:hypothetical protein
MKIHRDPVAFRSVCLCALVILASAFPASAQDFDEGAETARYRFAFIRFTPSVLLSDLGTDSNVFNAWEDPKQDWTAVATPRSDYWMRMGPFRLSGTTAVEYLYFREHGNQRSLNTENKAKLQVPLRRLIPFVSGEHVNTRVRPGYEIDLRARRTENGLAAGADVALPGRTTVGVSARRALVVFDDDQFFRGIDLGQALDRKSEAVSAQLRYRATPLTSFVAVAEYQEIRFNHNSIRDADSRRIAGGVEMKPLAFISGKASVGYRQFSTLSPGLPDYEGVVADIDVQSVVAWTRIGFRLGRDVAYSFEDTDPFFVLTDLGLSITQLVSYSWDIVVRGGTQRLAYRSLSDAGMPRLDNGLVAGGGMGYRVGRTLRVGLDVNYVERRSNIHSDRHYKGLRVGGSVSYGQRQ